MKAATKTETLGALQAASGVEKKHVASVLAALEKLAVAEVKKAGKFVVPGVVMIKTKVKPARKAGTKVMFGKTVKVKAAAAKTVVKCFAPKSLKNEFLGGTHLWGCCCFVRSQW